MPAYSEDTDPGYDSEPPPRSIQTAVRLMWTGAVLSLGVLVLGLLSGGSIKQNIADQLREQHNFSQHNVDTVYHNVVASTVVVAILAAGVWLWMARANGAGKRWARTTATVLGAVNVAGFVLSLTQGQITALQLTLSGLNVILAVAVLVFLWRMESTDFYYARSRRS